MNKVTTTFYKREKDPEKQIPDILRIVDSHIRGIGEENCDQAILEDFRGEIGWYLASERKTMVSWYPFCPDAKILEIGADFGAITGELCDHASHVVSTNASFFRAESLAYRYRNRKNLSVYAGDVTDMEFERMFDYIVIVNPIEKLGRGSKKEDRYKHALKYLQQFLKSDGKILFAMDNLYALELCQQPESALNPWQSPLRFSRNAFETLLKSCGLSHVKFYYPLPYYHLVGRVYTDEALPTAAEWNCLGNFAGGDPSYLCRNMELLQDLTDNGMFTHYAPAFFVESGREDNLCDLQQAEVLFDQSFDIPMLGFDWKDQGFQSLNEAVEKYREGQLPSVSYERPKRIRSAIFQVDQDHELMEKVLHIEFDLLEKLLDVCQKYDLKVYAMYGTLLGAVRCGGVIPGDDDIDVALMREDFDKLLTLTGEFTGEYFLQTPANDDCFYGGYLKLRNRKTSAIHPQNWWTNCCEGIGIDIFPMDSGYSNAVQEEQKRNKIRRYQRLLYAKSYGYWPDFKDMKLLEWKAYKYWGKLYSRKQLTDKLYEAMRAGDGKKDAPFGIYSHYRMPGQMALRELERKAFDQSAVLFYDHVKLHGPKDWDSVLTKLYGAGYMDAISWQEWKQRHGFYDVERNYDFYKSRFRDLMRPAPESERQLILFGNEPLFKSFLKKYTGARKPDLMVTLNGLSETDKMDGCPVVTWEKYLEQKSENVYAVIAAIDIRGAIKQLEAAGMDDYYIYLHRREWMQLANPTCVLAELESEE